MTSDKNSKAALKAVPFYSGAVGIFVATGWLAFMSAQPLLVSGIFYLNLFALTLYDLRYFRLPNLLTATLVIVGAVFVWLEPQYPFVDHVIGAAAGLLLFPTLNWFYRRFRGREGIGLGDAKLLAGLGLWLSWQALPPLLLIASVSGLVFALVKYLLETKNSKSDPLSQPLPFGAFLCLAGWLVWLFSPL